jgi:hypothetical protein
MKKLLLFAAIFCTSANVICMQTNEQQTITLARVVIEEEAFEEEAYNQWYFGPARTQRPIQNRAQCLSPRSSNAGNRPALDSADTSNKS